MGRERRRGNAKKELIDLHQDFTGFSRARGLFGSVGYLDMNITDMKRKRKN